MNPETKVEPAEKLDTSHITLAVPLDEIMRLKPFAADESYVRPYLSGVRFEAGEDCGLFVATDGHRLGTLRVDRSLLNGAGVVRLPVFRPKLDKIDRKNRQWLIVGTFAGEMLGLVVSAPPLANPAEAASAATLAKAHLIYANPLIAGDYPDWRRVVPSKVGRKTAAFNAKYLADFVAASGQKTAAITLYGDTDSEPHIVDIGSRDFIGVLMPMRADEIKGLPDWLTQPKLPKSRKKAA